MPLQENTGRRMSGEQEMLPGLLPPGLRAVSRGLRRDDRRRRRTAPPLAGVRREPVQPLASRNAGAMGSRTAADSRQRRNLQRLWRPRGHGSPLAARPPSPAHRRQGVGGDRGRPQTTGYPAHADSGRPVRATTPAQRRQAAAGAGLRQPRLPAPPARRRHGIGSDSGTAVASSTQPTWPAAPMGDGGCWRTGRKLHPAQAMPWRTASLSVACCPTSIAARTCTGCRAGS